MLDITAKDQKLKDALCKVLDQEEEIKRLNLLKEKLQTERQHICSEMKQMEAEMNELRATYEGQVRLIKNVTGHGKN